MRAKSIFGLFSGLLIIGAGLFWFSSLAAAQTKAGPKIDIIMVLDNSGSMQTNDPHFMTRQVVPDFLLSLAANTNIGMIIFDDNPRLALPLTSRQDPGIKAKVTAALNKLDYRGNWTCSGDAIERAIYELKNNGRKAATKLIIFMTDGYVDTGNKAKDAQQTSWLQNELAVEAKESGIRIFGIAYTETADFALLQTLGEKTGGDYYRVFKAGDIAPTFAKIQQTLTAIKPSTTAGSDFSRELILVVIAGLVVLALVAVILLLNKRKPEPGYQMSINLNNVTIPAAEIVDVGKVTGKERYRITKNVFSFGRIDDHNSGAGLDVGIKKPTVSALHAAIEYKNNNFYLIDKNSSNGTYIYITESKDGKTVKTRKKIAAEVMLKAGDEFALDTYLFKLILPQQIERGKTQLNPASNASGTVLNPANVKGSPSVPDIDKEVNGPKPDQSKEQAATAPDLEKATVLKPGMCPVHGSISASEMCAVCKRAFCKKCVVAHEGKTICKECRNKQGR